MVMFNPYMLFILNQIRLLLLYYLRPKQLFVSFYTHSHAPLEHSWKQGVGLFLLSLGLQGPRKMCYHQSLGLAFPPAAPP